MIQNQILDDTRSTWFSLAGHCTQPELAVDINQTEMQIVTFAPCHLTYVLQCVVGQLATNEVNGWVVHVMHRPHGGAALLPCNYSPTTTVPCLKSKNKEN